MKLFLNHKLLIILIFLTALSLRLFGLNWDQGQHLHPDERFLTMVAADIKLPHHILEYFDTANSPLNPYNYPNYQFFVYGTLPLFITKLVAVILHLDSYDTLHLIGRILSAIFDSFNIYCLYFLAKKINLKYPLLSPLLYAFTILPLQLSHFFAVDTYLNFFLLLTFTLLAYRQFSWSAVSFGLALACKISAVYFAPVIFLYLLLHYFKTKNIFLVLRLSFILLFISFIIFRIFQPYAFIGLLSPNPQFIGNLKTLQSYSQPSGWFPPSVQWLSKTKIIFPLQNIIFWGIGLPLSCLLLWSLATRHHLFRKQLPLLLSAVWCFLLFFLQATQFSYTMRYFLLIYPFLILLASLAKPPKLLLVSHCLFGLLFLTIYSQPHTRVQASDWIYHHLPSGSHITNEYWDDPLPLYLPGYNPGNYQSTMLALYDPDTPAKWQAIGPTLQTVDYLIMSSNRLWGSIPKVPDQYPQTTNFYHLLFAGQLNFTNLIEINSYPGLPLPFLTACYYFGPTDFPGGQNSWFSIDHHCLRPGVYLRDDTAEEAFTVYDHPKVLIFGRKSN